MKTSYHREVFPCFQRSGVSAIDCAVGTPCHHLHHYTSFLALLPSTGSTGYVRTAYLQAMPDLGALYATEEITGSPELRYNIHFVILDTCTL